MAGTCWIPLAGMWPVGVAGYVPHGLGTRRRELSTVPARHFAPGGTVAASRNMAVSH